jgi:putative spermidine/putrescine transport system substrate-binding protein
VRNKLICVSACLCILGVLLTGCTTGSAAAKKDLNSMTVDQIAAEAKKEGRVDSVGMPDSWADWGDTWKDLKTKYGIDHADTDMSSAEELALFESEKNNATKDIGDVGQSFGPTAVAKGLTLAYKTSHWNDIPDWAKDKDGNWMVGYYGTITIMTNTKLVPNAPKSFADLLKGDYKIAVGDVTKASQAQNAVLSAALANGGSESNVQPGLDFFKKIAEQGRLDKGELTIARLEKGEIAVALLWDYNSLNYRDQIKKNNPNTSFEVNVPSDGSIQSGYCSVINAYTKHPYAAALAREYIFSDEGQINLAKGYAKPIRSNVKIPDDIKAKLIPDEQYKNARMVKDQDGWNTTAKTLGTKWQEDVVTAAK